MSVDVFVFLQAEKLPTTAAWQEQLDVFDVGLVLDGSVEPSDHEGFWPVWLDGVECGFEFLTGGIAEAFGEPAPDGIGDRTFVANLITHSDLRELKASMLAAAALATVSEGAIFDPEAEEVTSVDEFLGQAQLVEL